MALPSTRAPRLWQMSWQLGSTTCDENTRMSCSHSAGTPLAGNLMKAWLLEDLTGIAHLHLSDVPEPEPQPGEALLELRFAALNPADRYLAEGQYPARPALPHILGRDGIGTVVQVGRGTT